MTQTPETPLLELRDLRVEFALPTQTVHAVRGVNLSLEAGKTLCIVGESGCGKSVTARAIMQLLDPPGQIVAGQVLYHQDSAVLDVAAMDPKGKPVRALRGREMGMIFQEPMASLSPVHTIADQVGEGMRYHFGLTKKEALTRVLALLHQVGLANPERVAESYPFQLSGGMLQRCMIALALACQPHILIADEPTTALDVTTQAQILELMQQLQADTGTAIILITHDLGVVAEIADTVAVMYLGEVVEYGPVTDIFADPRHPYTQALMKSVLRVDVPRVPDSRLETIDGMVPSAAMVTPGCSFASRCPEAVAGVCDRQRPETIHINQQHTTACHYRAAEARQPAPTAEFARRA
ncbi:ABC transporter ATP-binding protein [Gynuella sp.]|uniref:ABC transporter ATP-binding protein n=1 Tax=Gynuella sp. TaxID=2969146 RepID=UPI003D135DFE